MDSPSALKRLGQWLDLSYKFVLTLAAGSLIAGLVAAGMRAGAVRSGLAQAEHYFNQGRLAEADGLLEALLPWARCFPGRYRECAALRVRCLARLGRAEAASVAETMRSDCDSPVPRPDWSQLPRDPVAWLHQLSLSLVSGLMGGLYPPTLDNAWAGYDALIDELTDVEDRTALNALANQLLARFPHSLIALKAAKSRAELNPSPSPDPTGPAPAAPALPPTPSAVTADAPPVIERPIPSSPDPEPPPFPASWGIVTNSRAVAFNALTGQPVRELKPGDVLAIEGTGRIREEPALTGTLILNNRNIPDLLFRADVLEIRNGSFQSVSPQEVALRSRLAEIAFQENGFRLRLNREKEAYTPEEKAFREVQTRFDAFQAEVKNLTAQLDQKTGADRMRILERLRAMKYQEQTLLRALKERKQAVEKTGGRSGPSGFARDLEALLQEKQAILKLLAGPLK